MQRIHQLPSDVIDKIAAGEVIERPASVVKEMLENSVDAGATRIDIDIEEGGVNLIRIVDNGHGIEPEDLELAFARHATSKLTTADDLFSVRSMGFRGEALASIGGVADVLMQSRPPHREVGAQIQCRGGVLTPLKPWTGMVGTRIEVRNLFFNTPVRRRFLKTPATEIGHISEMVTRLALAFPGVHVKLTHNQKQVFDVPASIPLRERLTLFFGQEMDDHLIPIHADAGPLRIRGFIADPNFHRGNARLQYFFLNHRFIRDRTLGHALAEAYRSLIMVGRYCVSFLFLELPPDLVDVNVHPTKIEVRFRDSQAVYSAVRATIREALSRSPLGQAARPPIPQPTMGTPARFQSATLPPTLAPRDPMQSLEPPPATPSRAMPTASHSMDQGIPPKNPLISPPAVPPTRPMPPPAVRPRAFQLHDAYLIVEEHGGMLVIDQHALHERILYEHNKARLQQGALESQPLLVPEPVDLLPEQAAVVIEHREPLANLGLGIEEFGGNTLLVTRYPTMWKRSPTDLVKSVADHLATSERAPTPEVLLDGLLKMTACKAAVKAGDRLSNEEIASLIEQRHLVADTHHCPHGRPTALFFSKHDLDRQFKRT